MANLLIKEASEEALHLRKLLQKFKADINQDKLSKEESLKHIENMVKVASIIYAKLEFINKI
jgi:hypothetical protein